jgi:hypothetical protein
MNQIGGTSEAKLGPEPAPSDVLTGTMDIEAKYNDMRTLSSRTNADKDWSKMGVINRQL